MSEDKFKIEQQNILDFALLWWNSLPKFGAKNATFDEARFGSKGGLTQIYYSDKFPSELTNQEIVFLYGKFGLKQTKI